MLQENIIDGGHLQLAKNAMAELEDLHDDILQQEATYRAALLRLTPALNLLKAKTNNPTMSDIEACLILLYQVMMLHLQQREVSAETADIQKQATQVLQYLSKTYREQE